MRGPGGRRAVMDCCLIEGFDISDLKGRRNFEPFRQEHKTKRSEGRSRA